MSSTPLRLWVEAVDADIVVAQVVLGSGGVGKSCLTGMIRIKSPPSLVDGAIRG